MYTHCMYMYIYYIYICIHTYIYEFLVRQRLHRFENVVPAYLVVFIAALEMPDVIHQFIVVSIYFLLWNDSLCCLYRCLYHCLNVSSVSPKYRQFFPVSSFVCGHDGLVAGMLLYFSTVESILWCGVVVVVVVVNRKTLLLRIIPLCPGCPPPHISRVVLVLAWFLWKC